MSSEQKVSFFEDIHYKAEIPLVQDLYLRRNSGTELEIDEAKYLNLRKSCFVTSIISAICMPIAFYTCYTLRHLTLQRFQDKMKIKRYLFLSVSSVIIGANSMFYSLYYTKLYNPLELQSIEKKFLNK